MTRELSVSDAVYQKIIECQNITLNKSLNITLVYLALFFIHAHREKDIKE